MLLFLDWAMHQPIDLLTHSILTMFVRSVLADDIRHRTQMLAKSWPGRKKITPALRDV